MESKHLSRDELPQHLPSGKRPHDGVKSTHTALQRRTLSPSQPRSPSCHLARHLGAWHLFAEGYPLILYLLGDLLIYYLFGKGDLLKLEVELCVCQRLITRVVKRSKVWVAESLSRE